MKVFAGLEGGASFSKVVLLSESGQLLSTIEDGLSTNHLLVGLEECQNRINSMVTKAKQMASLDAKKPLDCLGLCMSGCEDYESNRKFERQLMQRFPDLALYCWVASDTLGSLMTASPKGGIVLIAGTGSNSLLYNPDDTTARCGGWGHILGDYGSAFWISQRAIKAVIECEDNYTPLDCDLKRTKEVIFKHFNVSDTFGLLDPIYVAFSKTQFSSVCKHLAKIAREENDQLCRQIFYEAGTDLAKHVIALLPKTDQKLLQNLQVVCVGSLFNSWDLLQKGFFDALNNRLTDVCLVRTTKSSAFGAAFLAVKQQNKYEIQMDFKQNSEILCQYRNGKIIVE